MPELLPVVPDAPMPELLPVVPDAPVPELLPVVPEVAPALDAPEVPGLPAAAELPVVPAVSPPPLPNCESAAWRHAARSEVGFASHAVIARPYAPLSAERIVLVLGFIVLGFVVLGLVLGVAEGDVVPIELV
jgi:hypothetical protein